MEEFLKWYWAVLFYGVGDHSSESYYKQYSVNSCGSEKFYYLAQLGGSNFWTWGVVPIKCDNENESYCGAIYYAVEGCPSFVFVDEILAYDHSNKSYWAALSYGVEHFFYAGQGGSNFFEPEDEILKFSSSN